jgi:hypothetical protein
MRTVERRRQVADGIPTAGTDLPTELLCFSGRQP